MPVCNTCGDWGYIYPRDAAHSGDTIPCPSCSGHVQDDVDALSEWIEECRAEKKAPRGFVLIGGVVSEPEPMWWYLYNWLRRQEYCADSDGEYITVWLPVLSFVGDQRLFYKMQCASAGGSVARAIDRERIPGIWIWSVTPSARDTIPYHRRLIVA